MMNRLARLATWIAMTLGLALCFNAASAHADDGAKLRRIALVIASSEGGEGRETLRHALSDAKAFAGVLEELGGLHSDNLLLLDEPDGSQLDRELAGLSEQIAAARGSAKRVELLVYFSGHSDRDGLLLGSESYSYDRLRKRLDALGADVRLVVLDSCSSGEMTRSKGGQRRPPFLEDDASDVRGYAILTSSAADEVAQESDDLQGSFFTHFLVSGLRGAADVNGDSRVTLNEAYQFAFHQTLARTEKTRGGAQHAAYDMELAGKGDLVLTDMRQTTTTLVLDEPLSGRIYVRGADGRLAVELDKRSGKKVTLGLPAGRYEIVRDDDDRLSEAVVELGPGQKQTVGAEDFGDVDAEETRARGSQFDEDVWTSEQPADLADQLHLRANMAEFRFGAGIHSPAIDLGDALRLQLIYRRGLSDRLNYIFPLLLSGQIWSGDSSQWVLSGGLNGLGYSSFEGWMTSAKFSTLFQWRPVDAIALSAGAATGATHAWGSQRSIWNASADLNLGWQYGTRLSGGLGAGYSRSQDSPGVYGVTNESRPDAFVPRDIFTFGAVGGRPFASLPLIQLRLWRGLHLYGSSSLSIEAETLQFSDVRGLVGISWFYGTGSD